MNKIKQEYQQAGLDERLVNFQTFQPDNNLADLEFLIFGEDMASLNNVIAMQNLPPLVLMFDEVELLVEFGGLNTLTWLRSLIQSMQFIVFIIGVFH